MSGTCGGTLLDVYPVPGTYRYRSRTLDWCILIHDQKQLVIQENVRDLFKDLQCTALVLQLD